jgi:hypothetical protein
LANDPLHFAPISRGSDARHTALSKRRAEMNVTRPMLFIIAGTLTLSRPVRAQLDNLDTVHRALIERGLQIHGRNFGPGLVLKDMLYIPGQHMDVAGNVVNNPVPAGMRSYPSGFYSAIKDPWFRGVHSISNLGSKNNGLSGDVILAWFQVADESLDGPDYTDQWYFLVANALVDPNGVAADTRQNIQLNFVNGVTKQVQRLNRETGQIDLVDLEIIPKTGGRRRLTLNLDGGTADLFKFNTGAPFVSSPLPRDYNLHDKKIDAAVVKRDSSPNPSLSWLIVLILIAMGLFVTFSPSGRTYEVKRLKGD